MQTLLVPRRHGGVLELLAVRRGQEFVLPREGEDLPGTIAWRDLSVKSWAGGLRIGYLLRAPESYRYLWHRDRLARWVAPGQAGVELPEDLPATLPQFLWKRYRWALGIAAAEGPGDLLACAAEPGDETDLAAWLRRRALRLRIPGLRVAVREAEAGRVALLARGAEATAVWERTLQGVREAPWA